MLKNPIEKPLVRKRAFVTLDALRGVAALPVVYIHTERLFGWGMVQHGHLAVDFFFLLSGFVMTYVYQERLDQGWSAASFLKARILRLYPLYILGTVAGIVFLVLQTRYGKSHFSLSLLGELALLGLLFLPAPPLPLLAKAPVDLYLFNTPAWSLFYELVANLLHAVFLKRKSFTVLACIVIGFAVALLGFSIHFDGLRFGAEREQYLGGACRVLFAYPCGILAYRIWSSGKGRFALSPLLIAALLMATLTVPVPENFNGIYEWLTVTVAFPFLLLAGATNQPPKRFARLSQWLGATSYPLYILHVPIFRFFEQIWVHVFKHPIDQDAPWAGLAFLVVVVPLVFWIGEHYDPEARKFLNQRVSGKQKSSAA
jgi:peptidoglycan/LPS O-acetylase OafA/YrhL